MSRKVVRPVLSLAVYQNACLGAAIRGIAPHEYIAHAIISQLAIDKQTLTNSGSVLCGSELQN
jgi:hypothetical protein